MLLLEHIFTFLAPHECLGCGLEGTLLCPGCWAESSDPIPSRCYRCHKLTNDSQTCERCYKYTSLRYVWVAASYDGLLKDLVHLYKFERAKAASQRLADILDESAPFFYADTLITYVPTATSRVRERGYDHAKELAKAFAAKRNLPVASLLSRRGQTRQVGATRAERLEQLTGAFSPKHESKIKNASIILVDDIVTTGATLETAARTLRRAGAKSVNGLVVAQKQ